ncbi:MAG: ParB/RepB/Spo0J family partition protein [Planctomycetes bacterium]|nr:ParB/RepB/Spo0J family partition protein [Planctomycetota bacterium]
MPAKKTAVPRLGRGLASLISNSAQQRPGQGQYESDAEAPAPGPPVALPARGRLLSVAIDDIAPNPYQPRRQFDEAQLRDLADSIATQGIVQPLVLVKPDPNASDRPYMLIAGERRLRAARLAGKQTVPCILKEATSRQVLEWALIENIHRADLNPIERARAYQGYIDRFGLTHAEAAERLGQPRTTVTNYLRLLELGEPVQQLLIDTKLTFGHAKILAGLPADHERQLLLAKAVVKRGLSVRQLEALVTKSGGSDPQPTEGRLGRPAKPSYVRDVEEQLTRSVGTRVTIHPARAKNTGKLVIEYYSLDDFDRISALLGMKGHD